MSNEYKYNPLSESGKGLPNVKAVADKTIFVDKTGHKKFYMAVDGLWERMNLTPDDDVRFKSLSVDTFFADKFVYRQINAFNGDQMFSDTGEVESVNGNLVKIKDNSGLNVCSFQPNDLIITKQVNPSDAIQLRYVKATVDNVVGNEIEVVYTSTDVFQKGDTVIRVGNTSDITRQDSVYIATNGSNTPFIDVYNGIVGFTGTGSAYWDNQIPKVRIGNGKGLNNSYSHGIYINDGGEFRILPAAVVDGVVTHTPVYTMGDTFPVSPTATDWHFYTKDPPTAPYKKNSWYKYDGVNWVNYGLLGTYITDTGIYTGTLIADQVISGTFTGLTFQTDSGTVGHYKRVEISASTNALSFYDASNVLAGSIGGVSGNMQISGNFNMEAGSIFGASGSTSFAMDYAGFIASYNDGVNIQRVKLAGGQLEFGVNSSYDINLYRSSANLLKTDDDFTANKIIKTGGTSSQFLKADGSVDSSTYVTGTPWTSEGYIVAPTPASGWLYNDGFGGYSWTEPTAADVGAAPSSHDNSNHSETYLTASTEGWRTIDVTGLGNGIGVSSGNIYVKASGGLTNSGGDIILALDSNSMELSSGNLKVKGGYGTEAGYSTPNILVPLTINNVTYYVAVYKP